MIRTATNHVLRLLFLVLLQVVVLNKIQLGGFINPYLYILFILMLPMETPKWMTLVFSFALGISIDLFSQTLGMHAAACVFMAYCRVFVLNLMAPREDYEFGTQPTIRDMGLKWFLTYAAILILIHHLFLFYVEVFRLTEFFSTFLRVALSFTFTFVLVLISQFLLYKKHQ